MDFAAIKSRLASSDGRLYWRSLNELSDTLDFREYLHREFPEQASEWNDPKGRRNFLKLMSASLALAGVGACTKQPPETLVPYVRQPEDIVPGRPLYFASAVPMAGTAMPVLVESHMGRPTKIEGNPEHPASPGGTPWRSAARLPCREMASLRCRRPAGQSDGGHAGHSRLPVRQGGRHRRARRR